jgi:hypothetical protein
LDGPKSCRLWRLYWAAAGRFGGGLFPAGLLKTG